MNLLKNKISAFFILFICLSETFSVYSQIDFRKADSCFEKKDYANALLEYERIYFLCSDVEALKKKAEVFKCRKEYGKAAFTLRRIPPYSLSQGEKDSLAYQVLLYYYLEDNFSEAEKYIKTIDLNVSENPSSQLLLIEILLLNELKEYTSAYEKLIAYEEKTRNFSAESKKCLDSLYSHIPKLKSENKAKNLSLFPGLGQIYAGYYTEGIFAFGLNAAILSFGVYELWHKDFVTAWIGGAGILSATYLGQQKQAVYLAQKRNYKRLSEFNKKIKTIILSEFE